MIGDFISNVIASTFFSSLLVGAGIWIARSWLSERLKNSIRAEYDQKLETHKAQLKSQSDASLERLRADLSIATVEHNIQFTRLHEKRAEVIAETYARLTELHVALGDYVKILSLQVINRKMNDGRRFLRLMKLSSHIIVLRKYSFQRLP